MLRITKTTQPSSSRATHAGLKALLFFCASLGVVHLAQASVIHRAESVGLSLARSLLDNLQTLAPELGQARRRPPRLLTLNGATLRLQSTSLPLSEGSIESLLDQARKECQTDESHSVEKSLMENRLMEAPLLEASSDTEGFIACLKLRRTLRKGSLSQFLQELSDSSDLNDLGQFQGLYLRAEEETLSVLAVEILDGFAPGRMFPQSGDSPGKDHTQIPRPSARRILSVALSDQTTLTSYSTAGSPTEALSNYEALLTEKGVNILHPKAEDQKDSSPALLARTESDSFIVTAVKDEEQSTLTIARLPH